MSTRYIVIDEKGYFSSGGVRIEDANYGRHLLESLKRRGRGYAVDDPTGGEVIVEAFDEPLIARHVSPASTMGDVASSFIWRAELPYEAAFDFDLRNLYVDRWDRFHGLTTDGLPFVFSRTAQADFFDKLEEFDDESITVSGHNIPVVSLEDSPAKPSTMMPPTVQLDQVLPQLKIPRAKWAVLGTETDAAVRYLKETGHIASTVTKAGEDKYDYILDYSHFHAVQPSERIKTIELWRKLLQPGGHLVGFFQLIDRSAGPPFGTSEWELREYLKKDFQFLYWTRWKRSAPGHEGQELVVYALKK